MNRTSDDCLKPKGGNERLLSEEGTYKRPAPHLMSTEDSESLLMEKIKLHDASDCNENNNEGNSDTDKDNVGASSASVPSATVATAKEQQEQTDSPASKQAKASSSESAHVASLPMKGVQELAALQGHLVNGKYWDAPSPTSDGSNTDVVGRRNLRRRACTENKKDQEQATIDAKNWNDNDDEDVDLKQITNSGRICKKPSFFTASPYNDDMPVAIPARAAQGQASSSEECQRNPKGRSIEMDTSGTIDRYDKARKTSEPARDAKWMAMFDRLKGFKKKYHHVNVSSGFEDRRLAKWCDHQRQFYKHNNLSERRAKLLLSIGFEWVRRVRKE